jgi:GNAT superfamily N-acetyltransferase
MGEDHVEIRRTTADDWAALRDLRLGALQDSPTAFCEAYADAVALPDERWQARAAGGAEGGDCFQVAAWASGRPVATCEGYRDGDDAGLRAVYVTPSWRGRGVLDRLVEEVVAWARDGGAPRVKLLVHETNVAAQRAYERLGFSVTGHREPYPLDPSTDEVEMARPLG